MKKNDLVFRIGLFCVCLAVGFIAAPPKAYAYLDPGLGSFLVQMLIAFLLGIMMGVKTFWGRIRAFFSRFKPSRKDKADK